MTKGYLDIYTNHDEFILLPDFSGIPLSSLDSIVESYNLRYEIIAGVKVIPLEMQ